MTIKLGKETFLAHIQNFANVLISSEAASVDHEKKRIDINSTSEDLPPKMAAVEVLATVLPEGEPYEVYIAGTREGTIANNGLWENALGTPVIETIFTPDEPADWDDVDIEVAVRKRPNGKGLFQ